MSKLSLYLVGIVLALLDPTFTLVQVSAVSKCDVIASNIDFYSIPSSKPVDVAVGLQLINVTAIEDTNKSISVDFIVTQEWTDQSK